MTSAPLDSTQLTKGRKLAALLMPPSALEAAIDGMAQKLLWPIVYKISPPAAREVAAMTGLDEADLGAVNSVKLDQALEIVDPAFYQRQEAMNSTLRQETLGLIKELAPGFREDMAQAFARGRSANEMDIIIQYFETWGDENTDSAKILLGTDPLFLPTMQKTLAKILEAMPSLLKKASAAATNLPKPRGIEDLTVAERAQFAALLGVSPDTLGRKSKP